MIDIWQTRFSARTPHREADFALLTTDERERAARFIDDGVRGRFIAGRGFLRRLLGRYLDTPPESLAFIYGARGKPAIPHSDLQFNLSHSDDLLLLAVTRGVALGADVERVRPMENMPTVARMNFSEAEQAAFFALPPEERERAFYAGWTRKEAYIKAVGDGFALPLKGFDVTLTPDAPPRLLRAEGDDVRRWSLVHLEPAEGYIAAICVEHPAPVVVLRGG